MVPSARRNSSVKMVTVYPMDSEKLLAVSLGERQESSLPKRSPAMEFQVWFGYFAVQT